MAAGVGCNWLQEAVVGEAATCGHSSGCKWLRMAANGHRGMSGQWPQVAVSGEAATRVAARMKR